MTVFRARGILLDIEGTTSSIRFVYDQMFPLVRRDLSRFLTANSSDTTVIQAADQIARDGGFASLSHLCHEDEDSTAISTLKDREARQRLQNEILRQMDADWKTTGLKQLQGLIWKSAFHSGELQAHLYPEVPACLRCWHRDGLVLRIYSSGSVSAQKLFFGHTSAGDLLPLLTGFDDTTTGPKKEAASYLAIAKKFGLVPTDIVFLSDSVDELHAAASAGMQVAWSCRPENPPAEASPDIPRFESFSELQIEMAPTNSA